MAASTQVCYKHTSAMQSASVGLAQARPNYCTVPISNFRNFYRNDQQEKSFAFAL